MLWVWAHPYFKQETDVPYIMGVSRCMLQRGNFIYHSSSVWAHHASERKLFVPYSMGVSRCMLQRGNFIHHTSWMWADACFREKTLCAIHHGCEQMHASGRKLYVPYIIDVSRCMLQGENFMCHTSWMWADACFREKTLCAIHHGCEQMHASGRKPYVPFIISVSTPITSENKCVMLHVVGLESPNIFKGHCYYFTSIHVIHCGCNYSHTIHSHLW